MFESGDVASEEQGNERRVGDLFGIVGTYQKKTAALGEMALVRWRGWIGLGRIDQPWPWDHRQVRAY